MNRTDFFQVVSSNNTFKSMSIAIFAVLLFLILPLIYGIVWFERHGSDKARILSNMLVSSCCWTVIECGIFVQFPHILRYIFGPLPQGFCFFVIIAQNVIISDFLMFFNAITLTKYILTFVLKNPAKFKNEFWHCFVTMWIKGFSLIFQTSWHICTPRQPIGYFICSGNNPLLEENPPPKVKGVIEIFSLLLHIFVYVRFKLHKKATAIGPPTHNFFLKLLSLSDIENMSLAKFVITFLNILFISISTINMVLINKLEPTLLVQYPYYVFVYFVFLLSPTSVTFFALLLYYCMNKPLQTAIINEFFNSIL